MRARRWSGLPVEQRHSERRVLLLDAAFDLLGTVGMAGTTVRAVCEAAQLNPRYFYESFADLDALVLAVYDRVAEELRAEVLAAITRAEGEGSPLREVLRSTVGFVDVDRRRARVLFVEALGNEELNRRRIATGRAVTGLVLRHGTGGRSTTPREAAVAATAAAVLVGGFSELLVAWLGGRVRSSREQLVDDATAILQSVALTAESLASRRATSSPEP